MYVGHHQEVEESKQRQTRKAGVYHAVLEQHKAGCSEYSRSQPEANRLVAVRSRAIAPERLERLH